LIDIDDVFNGFVLGPDGGYLQGPIDCISGER
jgi:hypothetical protein